MRKLPNHRATNSAPQSLTFGCLESLDLRSSISKMLLKSCYIWVFWTNQENLTRLRVQFGSIQSIGWADVISGTCASSGNGPWSSPSRCLITPRFLFRLTITFCISQGSKDFNFIQNLGAHFLKLKYGPGRYHVLTCSVSNHRLTINRNLCASTLSLRILSGIPSPEGEYK